MNKFLLKLDFLGFRINFFEGASFFSLEISLGFVFIAENMSSIDFFSLKSENNQIKDWFYVFTWAIWDFNFGFCFQDFGFPHINEFSAFSLYLFKSKFYQKKMNSKSEQEKNPENINDNYEKISQINTLKDFPFSKNPLSPSMFIYYRKNMRFFNA